MQNSSYDKISESNKLFKEAASDTINVANDIIQTLRNKIFDYSNQIDKISDMLYDGLFLVDKDGFIFSSNNASADIFEYKNKNALIGINLIKLLDLSKLKIDTNLLMEELKALAIKKNPNPYELFKGIKNDGSKFYIDISISEMKKSDNSKYYLLLIRDTTDRVTKEKLLRNLFNITGIKSAIIDENMDVVYSSIEFTKMFDDVENISKLFDDKILIDIKNNDELNFTYKDIKFNCKTTTVTNKKYFILTAE